jgi:hypothetical protein
LETVVEKAEKEGNGIVGVEACIIELVSFSMITLCEPASGNLSMEAKSGTVKPASQNWSHACHDDGDCWLFTSAQSSSGLVCALTK